MEKKKKWKRKKEKKDSRFTLDRIHRGMDADGEETSEIAIKRMTKQKKKEKKGRDRRRGDPVVINGTRSMRKHYVIDGESRHRFERHSATSPPLQFHSADFPRGPRRLACPRRTPVKKKRERGGCVQVARSRSCGATTGCASRRIWVNLLPRGLARQS